MPIKKAKKHNARFDTLKKIIERDGLEYEIPTWFSPQHFGKLMRIDNDTFNKLADNTYHLDFDKPTEEEIDGGDTDRYNCFCIIIADENYEQVGDLRLIMWRKRQDI